MRCGRPYAATCWLLLWALCLSLSSYSVAESPSPEPMYQISQSELLELETRSIEQEKRITRLTISVETQSEAIGTLIGISESSRKESGETRRSFDAYEAVVQSEREKHLREILRLERSNAVLRGVAIGAGSAAVVLILVEVVRAAVRPP